MSIRRDRTRRKKSNRVLGLVIVSLVVIAAALVIYLIAVVVRSFGTGAAPEATVPNVIGLNLDDAERKLNEVNLGLREVESAPSDKYPVGTIVSQIPIAGSVVRENKQVQVVRSLGKPSLKVPKVAGLDFATAQKRITEAGLALGVVQKIYTKKYRAGDVITQNPEAEKVFTSPVKVDLTIAYADAAEKVTVPDMAGKSLATAESMLFGLNLQLKGVQYQESGNAAGEVLSQEPEAGAGISPGGGVELVVAISADMSKATASDFRFTFRLPPGLPGGELRLEVQDDLGKQAVYKDTVEAGENIEQTLRVQGHASIRVYLDGTLIREDKI
jgi:beta-lactam-binding protein with PASTA domain